MGDPAKKNELDEKWQSLQPQIGGTDDFQMKVNPFYWIRRLYFRFFGPRKHPRHPVNFYHPIRVSYQSGSKRIEFVVEDISTGGLGLRCTVAQSELLPKGETIEFRVALDGKEFESLRGEVRFVRKESRGAVVGVKFVELTSNFLGKLKKEVRRTRREVRKG